MVISQIYCRSTGRMKVRSLEDYRCHGRVGWAKIDLGKVKHTSRTIRWDCQIWKVQPPDVTTDGEEEGDAGR
ncbi:hypothetical protein ACLOJK_039166 [Asimina triloba]